ncbi:hypothetical protein [uncultured Ottowia sp.]|uniref:hypothetical protein n=1 Tax=uncultured Ottowia sp. TaxID=543067 RepID=UPI00259772F0|nr:hypothetical protein [uncultured Ottowia sp.]
MTQPVVIQCSSACTVTHQISIPVLDLPPGDALQIGIAILLVWAVGWGFRTLIRSIRDGSSNLGDET